MSEELSERQQKLLKQMETTESKEVHAMLGDELISPEELSGWLREPAFQKRVRMLRLRMRFCIQFDILRAGWLAARRIAVAASANNPDTFKNGSGPFLTHIVRIVFGTLFRRRTRQIEALPPLFHPSLSAEQSAKLYAELTHELDNPKPWSQRDDDEEDDDEL